MNYSVVIPVYNGELTVVPLFERLNLFFNKTPFSFEVIFVYDCGEDNSWPVLMKLKTEYPDKVKLIKLSRNFGQHNALICGFEFTTGEFVITMDEDLQQAPEDIETLINKQKEADFDVVYGKYEKLKHSAYRNLSSSFLKNIIHIGIPDVHSDYSAFRLLKSTIAKATIDMNNSYTFLDGYVSWITTNCTSCIVSHSERQQGKSSYTFTKLVNHSINIFVTFSDLPIRLLSIFSFILLGGMTIFGAYVICRKIIFNDFDVGYPSLILSIGFGVGFIMLALGIIGEYIYRINLKTTKRPNYKVDIRL